ncbi:hypothetical protein HYI11_15710 [Clostridium botulinum]|uniref:hypothetical protein n=1 Tax=Clostridium botulinum TaxID=1491 RepID=UPI001C9AE61F|nr:hypothetical protein [Clostridium botulinum]MBY6980904.1 hypothetical protein [Clostridium botulinum]
MNMSLVDNLIEGLQEWNNMRNTSKAQDYSTLLSIINHKIGIKCSEMFDSNSDIETQLKLLKERVLEQCNEQRINEVMLIEGIVAGITRYFNNGYERLVDNLAMNEEFGKKNYKSPKMFEKIKTIEYRVGTELDEEVWNKIAAKRFNKYSFNRMDNQEFLENSKKFGKIMGSLPEEDKNLTIKEFQNKYDNCGK